MWVYTWNQTHKKKFHRTYPFLLPQRLCCFFSTHACCILLHKPRAFHSYKCGLLCFESTRGSRRFPTGRLTRDCGSAGLPASCCPFLVWDRKNNSRWCHEDKCHTAFAPYLLKWTHDWFPWLVYNGGKLLFNLEGSHFSIPTTFVQWISMSFPWHFQHFVITGWGGLKNIIHIPNDSLTDSMKQFKRMISLTNQTSPRFASFTLPNGNILLKKKNQGRKKRIVILL